MIFTLSAGGIKRKSWGVTARGYVKLFLDYRLAGCCGVGDGAHRGGLRPAVSSWRRGPGIDRMRNMQPLPHAGGGLNTLSLAIRK